MLSSIIFPPASLILKILQSFFHHAEPLPPSDSPEVPISSHMRNLLLYVQGYLLLEFLPSKLSPDSGTLGLRVAQIIGNEGEKYPRIH
jgi:hypothetical protein